MKRPERQRRPRNVAVFAGRSGKIRESVFQWIGRCGLSILGFVSVADRAIAVEVVVNGESGVRRARIVAREAGIGSPVEKLLGGASGENESLHWTSSAVGGKSEDARYDFDEDIAYLAAYAPATGRDDGDVRSPTASFRVGSIGRYAPQLPPEFASVGLYSLEDASAPPPPDSMIGVRIQRDHIRNELTLTITGGLRTQCNREDETPVASFRLQVFPDLATMERDSLHQGDGGLFDGEVEFGHDITARDGFSVLDFICQNRGHGQFTARPMGHIRKIVSVPEAASAVVRLITDVGRVQLPANRDSAAAVQKPAITMMWAPRPNPSRRDVTFRFSVSRRMPARLVVFDVQGRRVAKLVEQVLDPGLHDLTWDRRDLHGNHARGGIYFVRFEAEGRRFTRRLLLLD